MTPKILLADDSLTIQKVIKITLAQEPYELVTCDSFSQLYEKIDQAKPKLILLDFTLSPHKDGNAIVQEIKQSHPEVQVVLMFGTFDNIDEKELAKSGAADKIVKPFDSYQLIALCKRLIPMQAAGHEVEVSEQISEQNIERMPGGETTSLPTRPGDSRPKKSAENEQGDNPDETTQEVSEKDWIVQVPDTVKDQGDITLKDIRLEKFNSEMGPILQEGEDWGIEIPSIIGRPSLSATTELPGVISQTKSEQSHVQQSELPSERPRVSPEEIGIEEDFWKVDDDFEDNSSQSPSSEKIQTDSMIQAVRESSRDDAEENRDTEDKGLQERDLDSTLFSSR